MKKAKQSRIELRIEPSLKRRWQHAAGRLGLNLSSFITQSVMAALVQCEYGNACGRMMPPVFPPRPNPEPEAAHKAVTHPEPSDGMPSERHTQDATFVAACIVVGAVLVVLAILLR